MFQYSIPSSSREKNEKGNTPYRTNAQFRKQHLHSNGHCASTKVLQQGCEIDILCPVGNNQSVYVVSLSHFSTQTRPFKVVHVVTNEEKGLHLGSSPCIGPQGPGRDPWAGRGTCAASPCKTFRFYDGGKTARVRGSPASPSGPCVVPQKHSFLVDVQTKVWRQRLAPFLDLARKDSTLRKMSSKELEIKNGQN